MAPPIAHKSAPMMTVTFLPAKSESGPESRAPNKAPSCKADTMDPCTEIISDEFLGLPKDYLTIYTSKALVSRSSSEEH